MPDITNEFIHEEGIVGSWFLEVRQGVDPPIDITMVVNKDGGFSQVAKLSEEDFVVEQMSFSGSWSLSNSEVQSSELTLKPFDDGGEALVFVVSMDGDKLKLDADGDPETAELVYEFGVFRRMMDEQSGASNAGR